MSEVTKSAEKTVLPSRWLVLASCLLVQSLCGTVYSFSLFSGALKNRLGLSQVEVDSISSVGHIGLCSSIVAGIFVNKHGCSKAIYIGVVLATTGWLLMTLITLGTFGTALPSAVWTLILCVCYLLYQHGNAWFSTCAIVTAGRSFPGSDRPVVLSMIKAYFGLSSAFMAEFKAGLCRGNVSMYMVAVSLLIPIGVLSVARFFTLLPTAIANNYQSHECLGFDLFSYLQLHCTKSKASKPMHLADDCGAEKETNNTDTFAFLTPWFLVTGLFAVYLITILLIEALLKPPPIVLFILFALAICIWLTPFAVARLCHGPLSMKGSGKQATGRLLLNATASDSPSDATPLKSSLFIVPLPKESIHEEDEGNGETEIGERPNDVGIDYLLRDFNFYAMYGVLTLMAGSGISLINNMAQIVESLNSDKDNPENEKKALVSAIVSMFSFCNFWGRICSGGLLKYVLEKIYGKGISTVRVFHRFAALGIVSAFMCLAFCGLVFFENATVFLFLPTIPIGFGLGFMFGSILILSAEMYGTRYLGGNYSLLDSGAMVGNVLFATAVAGVLYDHKGHEQGEGNNCYGRDCFVWAFVVCAFNCAFASFLCFVLFRRTKLSPY